MIDLHEFLSESTIKKQVDLASTFATAKPFRHVVIDNFLTEKVAEELLKNFPIFDPCAAVNEHGVVGGKATQNKVRQIGGVYARIDDLIASEEFRQFTGKIVGIDGLIYDPEYFGGGTHDNLSGQELDPHVDFNYQLGSPNHRRLNLIVYLNKGWDPAWGGQIEIHSNPRSEKENIIRSYDPIFNRCVIFETNEYSWHGFPRICIPEKQKGVSRKSFAIYYYSKDRPTQEIAPQHGTFYVQRPLPDNIYSAMPDAIRDVVRSSLRCRDDWIRFYQKKELEFGRDLESTRDQLKKFLTILPPNCTGSIKYFGRTIGLHPDGWLLQEFECDFTALGEVSLIAVDLYVPKARTSLLGGMQILINNSPTRYSHSLSGKIVVDTLIRVGQLFNLKIQFQNAMSPKALGEGDDERPLSVILRSISGC